jgi:hypothetical protein
MNGSRRSSPASWQRATTIISGSRVSSMVRHLVDRCASSRRASTTDRLFERVARAFAALGMAERYRVVALGILVAVTAHLIMTTLLPSPVRGTPWLSAAALLAASLAAIAASARSR